MTAPAQSPEERRARFRAIVARRQAISLDWQRGGTPTGDGILARAIMEKAPEPILTFDPWADRGDIDFICHAPADMEFLIGMILDLGRRLRRFEAPARAAPAAEEAEARKPYSAAQNRAIHCGKSMFQRYMHEVHGLDHPHDPQRMATKIRSLLVIKSRADLDTDEQAAARWHDLRAHYKAWKETKL